MNKRNFREKGFTLIELLIVIVIIGILSGVLIAVINPVRQQNRSRNATIKAALNKASFAINTARAGLGRLPYDPELDVELENFTVVGTTCDETDELACQFNLAGTVLPMTCGANAYSGDGEVQCNMYVASPNVQGSQFRIIAKAFKLNPGDATEASLIYVFDSGQGMFQCPATVAAGDFATVPTIPTGEDGCTPETGN